MMKSADGFVFIPRRALSAGDTTNDQRLHPAFQRRCSIPPAVAPHQQQRRQHQSETQRHRQAGWRAAAMKDVRGGGDIAAAATLATRKESPPQSAQHSVKSVSSPPNPFRVAAAADLPNPFHAAAATGSWRRASAPAQAQTFGKFADGGTAAGGPFHQPLGSRPPWGSATPSQQLSEMTAIGSLPLPDAGLQPAQQHPAAPSNGDGLLAKLQVHYS
jgi:hypothetical protein